MGNNQPKKYRNFMIGAASAALVASAVAPVASAAEFSDVKGNTHEAAINALVEAGVINGYPDGTFKPNKTLTRSDVVKMMGKWLVSLDYEIPADYKTNPRFKDHSSKTNDELLKYSALVKDNGVFNGYPDGTLGAGLDITRENMAIVLVRAYDAIHKTDLVTLVKETEFDKDVTDRATAKAEARPYIDVLDYFDITNPVAPQFNPKNTTTRGQFASFLYKTSNVEVGEVEDKEAPKLVYTGEKTLNVEYGKEFTAPVVTATDNVDEEIEVTSVITNEAGERLTAIDTKVPGTYKITYSAVDAAGNSAEDVVVTVVVGENPVPEVVSVTADNAKEIVIDFNSKLDAVTAEKESNYVLKVNGAAENRFTAKLDDNGKRVVLTLTDAAVLANDAAIQLTVSKNILNEKLAAGLEDYSKTWVFSDKVAPKLTKVEKVGDDVKVTFDEYVKHTVSIVKVNGVDKTVATETGLVKTLTITDGAKGLGNGNYEVLLSGVTDAAGNASSVLTGTVSVSDDAVAPAVTKVEQISENKVKVTFSKNVTGATFKVKKNGYDLNVAASPTAGPEDEYVLTLSDAGVIKVYEDGQSSSVVTLDVTGYKGATNNLFGTAYTTNVTLNKDTTAPTVVERFNEIVDDAAEGINEVFHIRFNEELSAADKTKITLTDKDGIRRTVNDAKIVNDAAGKATILEVVSTAVHGTGADAGKIKVGTYSLNLGTGAVKDLAANSNVSTNVTISKSATVSELTASATADANVITVDYGAEMTDSALSTANYLFNGKSLPSETNIYFDGDKQTVAIELPEGSVASSGSGVLTISDNVVSTSGSKVRTADLTQNITTGFVDNVKPVLVSANKASTTSIELTFSENIDATTADLNDFVVKINGNTVAYTDIVDGTVGDNKLSLTVPTYNTSQTVTVSVTGTASDISLVDLSTTPNKLTASTTVTAN